MRTVKVNSLSVLKVDMPPSGHASPSSGAFDILVDSVKTKGLFTPVFINRGNVVKDGHYRYWAAKAAGLEYVPVVEINGPADIATWFDKQSK